MSQGVVAERGVAEQGVRIGGAAVLPLGDDVALIQRAESGAAEPYGLYLLNRQAQELSLRPSFETLVAPPLAQEVIPYEHQLNTVRRASSSDSA